MKIQDIFNLQKNKGGAKLFNRIMNRYGIPKEDSKELKNNIDNSSSSGGGGILYLKYNGERHFMDIRNNPFIDLLPIIAGVAIYNAGGSMNTIRSYYITELYRSDTFIDGFGEMAIPKIECHYGNKEFGLEYMLNTNSLENIYKTIAKVLVDNSELNDVPITFEEAVAQVKEMSKNWEECSEEEFYEIFNRYRQ